MQRAAIFNYAHELQPSVFVINRYGLQPDRSLCKIKLYKESAYRFSGPLSQQRLYDSVYEAKTAPLTKVNTILYSIDSILVLNSLFYTIESRLCSTS